MQQRGATDRRARGRRGPPRGPAGGSPSAAPTARSPACARTPPGTPRTPVALPPRSSANRTAEGGSRRAGRGGGGPLRRARTVWVTWRKKTPTRSTQTGRGGAQASRRSASRCSGAGADACGRSRLRARAPNENGSVSPARTATHESSGAHHALLASCSCSLREHVQDLNTVPNVAKESEDSFFYRTAQTFLRKRLEERDRRHPLLTRLRL